MKSRLQILSPIDNGMRITKSIGSAVLVRGNTSSNLVLTASQTFIRNVRSSSSSSASSAAASATAAPAKITADTGKKLFEAACSACHGAGIAGAPKFGDKAAWSARVAQGKETLYTHAIKGYQGKGGVMPAKGGSNASDEEVKAAVDYMIAAVK